MKPGSHRRPDNPPRFQGKGVLYRILRFLDLFWADVDLVSDCLNIGYWLGYYENGSSALSLLLARCGHCQKWKFYGIPEGHYIPYLCKRCGPFPGNIAWFRNKMVHRAWKPKSWWKRGEPRLQWPESPEQLMGKKARL